MQIFSRLQRNSTYNVSVKILIYFLIAILNSAFLFFPIFIGLIVYKESLVISMIYILFFSVLHQIPLIKTIYFLIFIVFFDYFFKYKINDYVNKTYQGILGILIIYIFYYPIVYTQKIAFYYVIYNLVVDILIFKLLSRDK